MSFNEFACLSGESCSVLKDAVQKAQKDRCLVASGKRRRGRRGLSILLVFFSYSSHQQLLNRGPRGVFMHSAYARHWKGKDFTPEGDKDNIFDPIKIFTKPRRVRDKSVRNPGHCSERGQ